MTALSWTSLMSLHIPETGRVRRGASGDTRADTRQREWPGGCRREEGMACGRRATQVASRHEYDYCRVLLEGLVWLFVPLLLPVLPSAAES